MQTVMTPDQVKVIKYVPKTKLDAIRDVYVVGGAYFIHLCDGYLATRSKYLKLQDALTHQVIISSNTRDLRRQIAGIVKIGA